MSTLFKPATRKQSRLRMAIDGPSGSGKTFTALRFAFSLGKRIAIINSESGAVEKYLGLAPDGQPWQFDIATLTDFSPTTYTSAILAAGHEKYDVVIIDSLSHAWAGAGGALELKDKKAGNGGNTFTAWKDITPMHNRMIESILHSPCHVIATMRSKTAFVLEQGANGKQVPRKVGMEPIQRAGMEYEFDIYGCMDDDHVLKITKSRCPEVSDAVAVKPGLAFMAPVVTWLNDGSTVDQSFFAVTEADLLKFEKKAHDDERKEAVSQPKKSAMELMQEAAAAETSEATNGDGKITADQLQRLDDLTVALQCGEKISSALQKRGLGSRRELIAADAAKIIAKLEAELTAKKELPGPVNPPAVGNKTPTRATQEHIQRIRDQLKEWAQIDNASYSAAVAGLKKKLADAGFANGLSDLSSDDAARLYIDVVNRKLDAFFQRSLEDWRPKQKEAPPTAATQAAAA